MPDFRRPPFRGLKFEQLEERRLLTSDFPGAAYLPEDIRTGYGVEDISFGNVAGDGTGQTIAILGGVNDINALLPTDLITFDNNAYDKLQAPPSFTMVQVPGSPARFSDPTGGEELEEDLDIEWAHAMAPGASIVLVEAPDTNLDAAAQYAATLPGVSVVSSSYGYAPNAPAPPGEYKGETQDDADFTTPAGHQGVTFVAATGDDGFGTYAAFSPNVLAAGGTSLYLGSNGAYAYETYWDDDSSDAGGQGLSKYEPEPAYQKSFQSTGSRSIPDVSFDADPNTGVWVYSDKQGWVIEGGTSLAAPCLAGLIAIADQGREMLTGNTLDGPSQTLPELYSLPASDFNSMATASNISGTSIPTTGLGSPKANVVVPELAAYGEASQIGVIGTPPTQVIAGKTFYIAVAAEDSFGAIDTTVSGSVMVNGVAEGTFTDGVAYLPLSLTTAAQGVVLQLSGDGFTGQSAAINVVAANVSQLLLSTEPPASVNVGSSFGLAVTAEDPYGNVATTFSGPAIATLATNPGGATLGGTTTEGFYNGVATFSGLTLSGAAFGNTLAIEAGGLPMVTTSPIDVLNSLTITGAIDDNVSVTVVDASDYDVTINGVTTDYNTATYNELIYNGPTGAFSKVVFDDPADAYTANQSLDSTQLLGSNLAFTANNVANLYVYAGSGSTANVQVANGASGSNYYVAAASGGYSYIADPINDIFSQLIGFGAETVSGSDGSTYAYIYSTTNAAILGDAKGSTLSVGGVTSTLSDFSQLYVVGAADGTDQVTLDSQGGAFVGTPGFSYVTGTYSGASFTIGALYCANVTAQASTADTDTAFFYSYPQNLFNGSPTASSLSGTTQNASDTSYAFTSQANGYLSTAVLESGGGTDSVNLTSPTGGVFVGNSTVDTLSVASSSITVNTYFISTDSSGAAVFVPGASQVTVTGAGSSSDVAFLYDSPGSNALAAGGSTATLATDNGTLVVNDFGSIIAEQQYGASDTLQQAAVDFALSTTGNWTSV